MPNALLDAVTSCAQHATWRWCRRKRRPEKEEKKEERPPVDVGDGDGSSHHRPLRQRSPNSSASMTSLAPPPCTLDDSIPQMKLEKMLDALQRQLRVCCQASTSGGVQHVGADLLEDIARMRALIKRRHADPYLPRFSGRHDNNDSAHGRRRQEVAHIFVPERTTSDANVLFLEKSENTGSTVDDGCACNDGARDRSVHGRLRHGRSAPLRWCGWDFDARGLACTEDEGGDDPLYVLAADMFAARDGELRRALHADAEAVERFLRALPGEHLRASDVPFHNTLHVAHVLNGMHLILQGITDCALLPAFVRACCVLAAAAHDLGHVGYTNAFLVRSSHPFALASNDVSPQENRSLRRFFELASETGLLDGLSDGEYRLLRRLVIGMVLATDLANHFRLYHDFKNAFEGADLMGGDFECWDLARDIDGHGRRQPRTPRNACRRLLSPQNEAELLLLLQVVLKCADLSHMSADASVADAAVEALQEELFRQGDKERALFGRVITKGADRTSSANPRSPPLCRRQPEFMEVFVLPMFAMLASVFPGCMPAYRRAFDNYMRYKARAKQTAARTDYLHSSSSQHAASYSHGSSTLPPRTPGGVPIPAAAAPACPLGTPSSVLLSSSFP